MNVRLARLNKHGWLLAAAFLLAFAWPATAAAVTGDDDAIVVITGDVDVPRGDVVSDVVVVDGDVRIAGRVDGSVVVANGTTTVSGVIDGDLVAISDSARLLPGARIDGDLLYGGDRPRIAPSAEVTGEVSDEGWSDAGWLSPLLGHLAIWLGITVSSLILGLLLLLLAPQAAETVFRHARERPWVAVAIGLGVMIALPLLAVVALATLVALPLGIAAMLSLIPLWAIGYVTGAWILGRRIVGPPRRRVVAYLAGWGILRAAALIPVLGLIVSLAATVIGLGALAVAIGAARRDSAEAAALGT